MEKPKLILRSAIPPSVNHYLSYRAVLKHGKPYAMSYKTKDCTDYRESFCEYVQSEAARQSWPLAVTSTQHFYVDGIFYFPRVDMDANNYWKVLLDAITDAGVIWEDDNVVCERVQGIFYDAEDPHVDLVITPVEYVGVFPSAAAKDDFTANCEQCSRYGRNCSILRAAIAGRVQPYITTGEHITCLKGKKGQTNDH